MRSGPFGVIRALRRFERADVRVRVRNITKTYCVGKLASPRNASMAIDDFADVKTANSGRKDLPSNQTFSEAIQIELLNTPSTIPEIASSTILVLGARPSDA